MEQYLVETKRDADIQMLLQRWNQLKHELIPAPDWDVQVTRDGNWFVLSGWVDSFGTKGRLFSKVPEI